MRIRTARVTRMLILTEYSCMLLLHRYVAALLRNHSGRDIVDRKDWDPGNFPPHSLLGVLLEVIACVITLIACS